MSTHVAAMSIRVGVMSPTAVADNLDCKESQKGICSYNSNPLFLLLKNHMNNHLQNR
jgi:hypothetical protein